MTLLQFCKKPSLKSSVAGAAIQRRKAGETAKSLTGGRPRALVFFAEEVGTRIYGWASRRLAGRSSPGSAGLFPSSLPGASTLATFSPSGAYS